MLWELPYSGGAVTHARQIDIDHIIPLKWAHGHGADRWSSNQKQTFANDPENLLARSASANRRKGAKGPDDWTPEVNHCEYAKRWGRLFIKYRLIVLPVEEKALANGVPNVKQVHNSFQIRVKSATTSTSTNHPKQPKSLSDIAYIERRHCAAQSC